jgi:hypothetical protein
VQALSVPDIACLFICEGPGMQMAYDLVPPYPGSQLISSETSRQTNSGTDLRKYQTHDSIEEVLTFMRQQFPNQTIHSREGVYSLHVIDHSWLSNAALPIARNLLPDFTDLPQASIRIYPVAESGTDTIIAILFYWPLW